MLRVGFEDELGEGSYKPQELEMAKQLTGALRIKKFDLADFHDAYQEKRHQLVEAKAKGHELVAPPEEAAPKVINLMDALKASVQSVGRPAEKPARKMAASSKTRAAKKAKRKRASG